MKISIGHLLSLRERISSWRVHRRPGLVEAYHDTQIIPCLDGSRATRHFGQRMVGVDLDFISGRITYLAAEESIQSTRQYLMRLSDEDLKELWHWAAARPSRSWAGGVQRRIRLVDSTELGAQSQGGAP